ncbi:MAG: class I SAM-dependent methyltransferase [Alphaproteobacteria bacterium]
MAMNVPNISPDDLDTLRSRLKRRIDAEGPLSIAQYMELCLGDPDYGYYTTRDPFGASGDFITAPEISQIFGELIGLWCVMTWRAMGKPDQVKLIELGPGRGTLMADALRAAKLAPDFLNAAQLHLVEMSPVLREQQKKRLENAEVSPQWHRELSSVPDGPALIIANEFLDALPIRQLQKCEGDWFERCVGVSGTGVLEFCLSPGSIDTRELIPEGLREGAGDGDIAEIRPAAESLLKTVASRGLNHALAALFIDYGHRASALGDTFQAVKTHEYTDPLAAPGEADITTHVDFQHLAATAEKNGLNVHGPVSQAQFLSGLGLKERCQQLMKNASSLEMAEEISSGARRLVDATHMGELFQVIALTSEGIAPPPFTSSAKTRKRKSPGKRKDPGKSK